MTNFDDDDRLIGRMFESGNRLRFERPVDDAARREAMKLVASYRDQA
jgi:hypothetical protein